MGGYGSGGHNRKRIALESCIQIDAGMLRRAGIFIPTEDVAAYKWSYNNRGRHTCDLAAYNCKGNTESVLIAIFAEANAYRQVIRVSWAACHYGKQRAWLHCPKCGARVFRLYYYPNTYSAGNPVHNLACRACYGLTYEQRRQRGFRRLQTQAINYRGAYSAGGPYRDVGQAAR